MTSSKAWDEWRQRSQRVTFLRQEELSRRDIRRHGAECDDVSSREFRDLRPKRPSPLIRGRYHEDAEVHERDEDEDGDGDEGEDW